MLAIVQTGYGAPESVLRAQDMPRPEIGDDEVLVRMRSTSVNTPDWSAVTGTPYVLRPVYGLTHPKTPVRGTDVAGYVEAVGANVRSFAVGDSVFGSAWNGQPMTPHGSFAELAVARADSLAHKPPALSFGDVSCAMSAITALTFAQEVARIRPGMRVLINGASGGVGTYAVQMAKLLGAEVTGVCGTRNLELVNDLGADSVVDYTREDFTRGAERYDVILDNVLNHPAARVRNLLTPGGLFIPNSIGQGGPLLLGLPRMLGSALRGKLGGAATITCTMDTARLTAWGEMMSHGRVRTVVDQIFPLSEAAQAVARMLSHHARGNVLIAM